VFKLLYENECNEITIIDVIEETRTLFQNDYCSEGNNKELLPSGVAWNTAKNDDKNNYSAYKTKLKNI
jgi:hypothetical protein